MGMSKSN